MSSKIHRTLEELEEAAKTVGIKISYEKMTGICSGKGGLCKVKGELRLIVDRRATPQERLDHLLEALCEVDLEGVYLSPRTRDALDRCRTEGPKKARK